MLGRYHLNTLLFAIVIIATVQFRANLRILLPGDDEPKSHVTHYPSMKNVIPSNYNISFDKPRWKCTNGNMEGSGSRASHRNKLIFVHIFKTAGSSFRNFFRKYNEKCGKGVSVIISCTGITNSSLYTKNPNENWNSPCTVKQTYTRNHKEIHSNGKVTWDHIEKYSDILIGHFPIGLHANFHDTNEVDDGNRQLVDATYVTFLRCPYARYVSGYLFHNREKKWSFNEAVAAIKEKIMNKKMENSYKTYLTTPEQKELAKKNDNFSEEQWVSIVKDNIINMNVLVGIVEKMGPSVEMMHSIIDVDREITPMFQKLDMTNYKASSSSSSSSSNGKKKKKNNIVSNTSKLSTTKIVATLRQDPEVSVVFTELVKYEVQIYEFALKVHDLQYQQMKKMYGNRYSLT